MTAVTVHTDLLGNRRAISTRHEQSLVLRATLLAAFVECIPMKFGQPVTRDA